MTEGMLWRRFFDVPNLVSAEDNGDPQNWLSKQDLSKLKPEELTPVTEEASISSSSFVLFPNSRSSVDRPPSTSAQLDMSHTEKYDFIASFSTLLHLQSTLVKAISGVHTVKFKNELVRNITIKLGYANAKIYRCSNEDCPRPGCYRFALRFVMWITQCVSRSGGSSEPDRIPCRREGCGGDYVCVRHVSFVDCPGHDILMATMLNGAAVMDAAMLLVAGNETCPQPQTSEHLAAVEIMQLKNVIILQNKVDLIKESQAKEQQEQIKNFVQGTGAESAPVIPISAQLKYNIDVSSVFMIHLIFHV